MESKTSLIFDKKTRVNECGQSLLTTAQAQLAILNGIDISMCDFLDQETRQKYIDNYEQIYYHSCNLYDLSGTDPDVFHQVNSTVWNIPEEYMGIDVEDWLYKKCVRPEQTARVCEEIKIYKKYKLLDLLKVCMYLVDTFRKKNVIWGVGRGSSVSSYCLYLIGIHRVDSLKYNLDISEFLKGS